MRVKWLTYKSSDLQKNKFIDSYLNIFNSQDNLKFLSFTGKPFTKKQVNNWVYELTENSDIKYLFAEIEDQIVGIMVLKLINMEPVEIYGLGVRDGFKRKGIAFELLKTLLSTYESSSFFAKVFEDNVPMINLITKFGFKPSKYELETRIDGVKLVKYVKKLFI